MKEVEPNKHAWSQVSRDTIFHLRSHCLKVDIKCCTRCFQALQQWYIITKKGYLRRRLEYAVVSKM